MALRGERFVVDISDDENERPDVTAEPLSSANLASFSFVGDIVERQPGGVKPPTAPTLKSTTTGFPEHKNRTRLAAVRQRRTPSGTPGLGVAVPIATSRASQMTYQTDARSLTQKDGSFEQNERRRIDEENKQRLAAMSEEEIDQERQELLSSLSPAMIQSLLRRANLDDGRGDTGLGDSNHQKKDEMKGLETNRRDTEAISIPQPFGKKIETSKTVTFEDDKEPSDPGELRSVSEITTLSVPAVHFPSVSSVPELDPSDPSFLENLHQKYFPSLPADPSKLAWMAPVPTHGSIADQDSPYYPGQEALPASALRFDFRGGLLPPRISRAVPTNKGLHHHGEAPEAAGYTIPELARLARSAFPAQRCVAFQTLGRFLYRLGRGEWAEGTEMEMGLWRCVDEGKVVETLEEAASADGGHQGSKVYAVEAVWLWQKGGGKKWKAS